MTLPKQFSICNELSSSLLFFSCSSNPSQLVSTCCPEVNPEYSINLRTPRISKAGLKSKNSTRTKIPSNFPSGSKHKKKPPANARSTTFAVRGESLLPAHSIAD